MKLRKLWLLPLFLLFACNNGVEQSAQKEDTTSQPEQEEISTDVINNPATADEDNQGDESLPEFSFEKETHDFGQVVQGEKLSYSFQFTNTGEAPLVINNASASCGCTVPSYPREPIEPGKTGTIEVEFDSKGRSGKFRKSVTLLANTQPNSKSIFITGVISEN